MSRAVSSVVENVLVSLFLVSSSRLVSLSL